MPDRFFLFLGRPTMNDIPVLGIEEIVFEVKDLDRSVAFYRNVIEQVPEK